MQAQHLIYDCMIRVVSGCPRPNIEVINVGVPIMSTLRKHPPVAETLLESTKIPGTKIRN